MYKRAMGFDYHYMVITRDITGEFNRPRMVGRDSVRSPEDALSQFIATEREAKRLQTRENNSGRGPDAIVIDLFTGEATALDIAVENRYVAKHYDRGAA